MRKVFIDCGTNTGDGIIHFNNRYGFSSEWEIYMFEPNPYLGNFIESNIIKSNLQVPMTFINKAVCGEGYPEKMSFMMQKIPEYAAPIGGGSTLVNNTLLKDGELDGYEEVTVETLRLSNFIHNLMQPHIEINDNTMIFKKGECMVVVKLDVEGAEYDIINDLLNTGVAWAITDLHVEFHGRRFVESKRDEEVKLVGELFQRGVNVFSHF